MEKAGWVRRTDDPRDRRVYRVSLTPSGRSLWSRTYPLYRDAIASVTRGLEEKDLRIALRTLGQLSGAAEDWARAEG